MDQTHVVSAQLAGEGLNEGNRAICSNQLRELEVRWNLVLRALRCFYMSLGSYAAAAVDLAVRAHTRPCSPPRWARRNCTYGPFVRYGRRRRSPFRMRDDDARNASRSPKARRRNEASGSTHKSSLMVASTREIRTRCESGGFVRRSFPSASLRYADLFVLLDEMGPKVTGDEIEFVPLPQ